MTTDRYAVFGHPVTHTRSPEIHHCFATQTGESIEYRAIDVMPGDFAAACARFVAAGGRGANVTLPYKGEACALARRLSARARRAGAVNTITFAADGGIVGDNTDGVGLLRDLEFHGVRVDGRAVLLVGAGGAARGVVGPLLEARPGSLAVVNRTSARARDLVVAFADSGPLQAVDFDALDGRCFDLVVNATASSLEGQVPPLPDGIVAAGGCCYDMMYRRSATAFVEWGRVHGARVALDGFGMLVEQAAESFRVWRGVAPDTGPVRRALRAGD